VVHRRGACRLTRLHRADLALPSDAFAAGLACMIACRRSPDPISGPSCAMPITLLALPMMRWERTFDERGTYSSACTSTPT
jgi:hypothetical protein